MTADNQNEDDLPEGPDQRNLSIHGGVDESIVVLGDRNTIHQGPSYYTTNVFGSFDAEQFPVRPSQQLSQQEYRWRQVLVQNVKHYWIEGVLERSLHNQALIELGLEERAQAVASPISSAEEFANKADKPFPEGTQATDIFDDLGVGRTLLILGEPGAGKTTILLKLVQTLITRLSDDFSQPIPVILNLSSWAKKRKSIAEWLVQDLYETFQVSKALGTTWIKEEQLTLCLDGLDEVAAQHRNACLKALNHFLQTHGRTEVVVCSRIRDYEALSERLRLRCAIYVQPLISQQVDRYLEQVGEQLSTLRTVFSRNTEIRAFAASPLILSVMSLAYQGCPLDEFPDVGNTKAFRQRLFETYIERMFQRQGTTRKYSTEQAKHWLVWMAQQMTYTSQSLFMLERMQPSWLQSRAQRIHYHLESGLILGLISGLISMLPGLLIADPIEVLVVGGIFGLVGSLVAANLGDIKTVETLKWSWPEARKGCTTGLTFGPICGLFGGLCLGAFFGLTDELIDGLVDGLLIGAVVGLGYGLFVGLGYGLIVGLKGPEIQKRVQANQGVWKSARNAIVISLCFVLFLGIAGALTGSLFTGLFSGLFLGLFAGLTGGGEAFVRHFALRCTFYRKGYIPWHYARFLDYATERLFLQKVGGGYIFIHRMLLEHFAQMELEQPHSK